MDGGHVFRVRESCETSKAALAGLRQIPKALPAKLFYDEAGCRLFERISELPEYYLTRTERTLLETYGRDIALALGKDEAIILVEYGASSEGKATLLMRGVEAAGIQVAGYVPVDVAGHALQALRSRMTTTHPGLTVTPVVGDFEGEIALPAADGRGRLGFFPGSTIGNFDPAAAQSFLTRCRTALGSGSHLLVGYDLRKPADILIPAYDDASGVTAAFNLNLLHRLNRECGADFVVARFAHRAVWNDEAGRIEMHLVSKVAQTVRVSGEAIAFRAGETIHTENSYKFTLTSFGRIANAAGWTTGPHWSDPSALFALQLLKANT